MHGRPIDVGDDEVTHCLHQILVVDDLSAAPVEHLFMDECATTWCTTSYRLSLSIDLMTKLGLTSLRVDLCLVIVMVHGSTVVDSLFETGSGGR